MIVCLSVLTLGLRSVCFCFSYDRAVDQLSSELKKFYREVNTSASLQQIGTKLRASQSITTTNKNINNSNTTIAPLVFEAHDITRRPRQLPSKHLSNDRQPLSAYAGSSGLHMQDPVAHLCSNQVPHYARSTWLSLQYPDTCPRIRLPADVGSRCLKMQDRPQVLATECRIQVPDSCLPS